MKTMNNEAFERAKSAYGTGAYDDATMEFIFPQLAESEDERIRKDIINLIYWLKGNPSLCSQYYKDRYDDMLAYLEKKKEQKTPMSNDLDEEIERFFDECIEAHDAKIYGVDKQVITVDCYELTARHFAKWGEKQKEPENVSASTMVPSCWEVEQKEQKPAEWSEEDDKIRQSIIKDIELERNYTYATTGNVIEKYNEQINWLKSLRNRVGKESLQPHWKPSEEQMKALFHAVNKARTLYFTSIDGCPEYNDLRSLYEQLKNLM